MENKILSLYILLTGDTTGTDSYFTTFEDFEIMFHVSTLLPFMPNDPSRVQAPTYIISRATPSSNNNNDSNYLAHSLNASVTLVTML